MAYCEKCKHRIVLPAFTQTVCKSCSKTIISANTPGALFCEECAENLGVCEQCGQPIVFNHEEVLL